MKKIMFNDKYGLTDAVLNGKKTMTRRIIKPQPSWVSGDGRVFNDSKPPMYKVGEIVAVAQAYKHIVDNNYFQEQCLVNETDAVLTRFDAGWDNKMFVKSYYMPHHILITDIKVERLQDISEEDVYKEAFTKEFVNNGWGNAAYHEETILVYYDKKGMTKTISSRNPKEAFSSLIDKLCGVGTWDSNPCVFVYSFKLID